MASVGDARCRHLSSTSSPLPEDSFALHKHNMHDLPAVAKPMLAKPAWPKHLVPFINTDADGSPRSFLLVSTELGTQATWIARLNPFPPRHVLFWGWRAQISLPRCRMTIDSLVPRNPKSRDTGRGLYRPDLSACAATGPRNSNCLGARTGLVDRWRFVPISRQGLPCR